MSDFEDSYLGRLRTRVGSELLLIPGARVVVEDMNGRILLQKRSDFGVWGLPGGNAEPREAIEVTAVREVFEETGLVIADIVPFGFASNPKRETVQFPNGDKCQFFVMNFTTRTFSGDLAMLDGQSLSLDWFAPETLPDMLPNMEASVRAFERFRDSGQFQSF